MSWLVHVPRRFLFVLFLLVVLPASVWLVGERIRPKFARGITPPAALSTLVAMEQSIPRPLFAGTALVGAKLSSEEISLPPDEFPIPWQAYYFANSTFQGEPFQKEFRSRIGGSETPFLSAQLGSSSPHESLPSGDRYSIRFVKEGYFAAGTYRFNAFVDDHMQVRLYKDGREEGVLDWDHGDGASSDYGNKTGELTLSGGTYTLEVRFREETGSARAELLWELITPTSASEITLSAPIPWEATYYSSPTFGGIPTLSSFISKQEDGTETPFLRARLGYVPPIPEITVSDRYSIRFQKQVTFPAGEYKITAFVDDHATVSFIKNGVVEKVLNWNTGSGDYGDKLENVSLTGGSYTVRVDYVEDSGGARIDLAWELLIPIPAGSPQTLESSPEAPLEGGADGAFGESSFGKEVIPTVLGTTDAYTGSATFSVPFVVPDGPGGLAPALSLTYSSASLDDARGMNPRWKSNDFVPPFIAGHGFSVSGTPYIVRDTRGRKEVYRLGGDSFHRIILVLPGVGSYELRRTAGEWTTVPQSFIRIRHDALGKKKGSRNQYDVLDGGQWEITTPEGMTYFLGEKDLQSALDDSGKIKSSRAENLANEFDYAELCSGEPVDSPCSEREEGGYPVLMVTKWLVTQQKTPDGRTIEYRYDTKQRTFPRRQNTLEYVTTTAFLKEVLWNDAKHRVLFDYESRPDKGYDDTMPRRLTVARVQTKKERDGSFATVRSYHLGYYSDAQLGSGTDINSHNLSFLHTITEKGEDERDSLPPMEFTYQKLGFGSIGDSGESIYLKEINNGWGGRTTYRYEAYTLNFKTEHNQNANLGAAKFDFKRVRVKQKILTDMVEKKEAFEEYVYADPRGFAETQGNIEEENPPTGQQFLGHRSVETWEYDYAAPGNRGSLLGHTKESFYQSNESSQCFEPHPARGKAQELHTFEGNTLAEKEVITYRYRLNGTDNLDPSRDCDKSRINQPLFLYRAEESTTVTAPLPPGYIPQVVTTPTIQDYGDYAYRADGGYVVRQSLILTDKRNSLYRECFITEAGDPLCDVWNQLSLANIRGVGNETYRGYGAFAYPLPSQPVKNGADLQVTRILTLKQGTEEVIVPEPGQVVTLAVELANKGTASSGPFQVRWKVGNSVLTQGTQANVDAGQSIRSTVRIGYLIPAEIQMLEVMLDADNTIKEPSEENNRSFLRVGGISSLDQGKAPVETPTPVVPGSPSVPPAGELPIPGVTVSITQPLYNQKLRGNALIEARIQGSGTLRDLVFLVDGKEVGRTTTRSTKKLYSFQWDTRTVPDGAHTISALVTDTQNAVRRSIPRLITVANDVVRGDSIVLGAETGLTQQVEQSLLSEDGKTLYSRVCQQPSLRNVPAEALTCGVWNSTSLGGKDGLPQTLFADYGAYLSPLSRTSGEALLFVDQSLITQDNKGFIRTCPVPAKGESVWTACSTTWNGVDVSRIRGAGGEMYRGYDGFTFRNQNVTKLFQSLVSAEGSSLFVRTCSLVDSESDPVKRFADCSGAPWQSYPVGASVLSVNDIATELRTNTRYEYDALGNVRATIEEGQVDSRTGSDSDTGTNRYAYTVVIPNESGWLLRSPALTYQSEGPCGENVKACQFRRTEYAYDDQTMGEKPLYGLLTSRTQYHTADGAHVFTEKMSYENLGGSKRGNEIRRDIPEQNKMTTERLVPEYTRTFDSYYHTLLTSEKNAQGHEMLYENYNVVLQVPQTVKRQIQLAPLRYAVDTYQYDGFGRMIRAFPPDPVDSARAASYPAFVRSYVHGNAPDNGLRMRELALASQLPDGALRYRAIDSFLDGFGNKTEMQELSTEIGGSQRRIIRVSRFNARGYITQELEPMVADPIAIGDYSVSSLSRMGEVPPQRMGSAGGVIARTGYDRANRVVESATRDPVSGAEYVTQTSFLPGSTKTVDSKGVVTIELLDEWGRPKTTQVTSRDSSRAQVTNHSYAQHLIDQPTTSTTTTSEPLASLTETVTTRFSYTSGGAVLSTDDPSFGMISYQYDIRGNVVEEKTNGRDRITSTYDALNRMYEQTVEDFTLPVGYKKALTAQKTGISYDSAPNGVGKIHSLIDTYNTTVYRYDLLGRPDQIEHWQGSKKWKTTQEYTALSSPRRVTHPDGTQVQYDYDAQGRLALTRIQGKEAARVASHDKYGNVTGATLSPQVGAALSFSRTWDGLNRPLSQEVNRSGEGLFSQSIGYTATGEVEAVNDFGSVVRFGYDGFSQLTSMSAPWGNGSYTYDALGRLRRKSERETVTLQYSAQFPFFAPKEFAIGGTR